MVARHGEQLVVSFDRHVVKHDRSEPDVEQVLALDDAFQRLDKQDPRAADVVRLRFFAGLSVEETAKALDVSERTVKREWAFARAWLFDVLRDTRG